MNSLQLTDLNKTTAPATPGEFQPLEIGPVSVWPPVVLAPMAGITNAPFRQLCRGFGAGLYVSEMVTARLLVQRDPYTLGLAAFAPDERPRSLQLYGIDPWHIGEAVRFLIEENRVDHIDLNFGCPVRKVTRKGGGSAIPLKPRLFEAIVAAAVANAGDIPVTIKFRIGINDQYQSYLSAGKIAEAEGCAAVALHARTAAQLYSGEARWEAIARLREAVTTIPVLGNGDIWQAADALRMMRQTGCDGVVIGRGCLGRPWLFADLANMFNGRLPDEPPHLGGIARIMKGHAELLCDWFPESAAMRAFRKHCHWYIKDFDLPELRRQLLQISTKADLWQALAEIDPSLPFPMAALRTPRGKSGNPQRVSLPDGYLENLDDATPPVAAAEDPSSGG